jgi:hypothetical protein
MIMKGNIHSFIYVILGLVLLTQGCDVLEYDVTVINDTDFTFSVYLDGNFQSQLRPGGSAVIKGVESGVHSLEAIVGNEVIAEKTVNLNEDMEWLVYVERYNITVTNQTDLRLSIYLDDSYQLEAPPFSSKMIYGVSEGTHTLEARVGGDIIANRNFYLDKDTEWILSY